MIKYCPKCLNNAMYEGEKDLFCKMCGRKLRVFQKRLDDVELSILLSAMDYHGDVCCGEHHAETFIDDKIIASIVNDITRRGSCDDGQRYQKGDWDDGGLVFYNQDEVRQRLERYTANFLEDLERLGLA